MLRGSLGGYTSADIPELFGSPLPLSEAIFNIISTFFGNETASLLIVSAVIIVFLLTFTRLDLLTKLGLIGGAICLVVPLISLLPVVRVGLLHQRWFFLPITASLITTAYLSRLIVSNIGKTVIYIIIFIASVSSTLHYINYPPFILVDKMLPTAILQGHNSAYIDIRAPYNRAASRLYSHWVYLTKLDKGFWGTRVISVPGQMEYHDLANRIPIDSNLQALGSTKRDIPPNQKNLDLIKNISQPNPSQLRFEFSDNLHDTDCFIYIFGKNNGNATRNQPCQNWRISIYNLNRMVREIGYTLDDASLAIWVDNGQKRLFSKPYNLSTLFDRYGIVLDDSIRGPVDAPPNRFVPVVERIKARLPLGIRNILDRNVFEVTALEDIVHSQDGSTPPNTAASTPNDFFLGKNWYPLERFDGEIFRWVNNDAEIVVTAPAGAQRLLRLEVEPGPGLGSQPFTLYLQNNKGQAVAQTQVQKREIVSISLPPFDVEGTQLFRLHVEGGGLSTLTTPVL